jgi:hypothetical protein
MNIEQETRLSTEVNGYVGNLISLVCSEGGSGFKQKIYVSWLLNSVLSTATEPVNRNELIGECLRQTLFEGFYNGLAVHLAYEPKRTILSGWNCRAKRSAQTWMSFCLITWSKNVHRRLFPRC